MITVRIGNDKFILQSKKYDFYITTDYLCHVLDYYTEVTETFNTKDINRPYNHIQFILHLN